MIHPAIVQYELNRKKCSLLIKMRYIAIQQGLPVRSYLLIYIWKVSKRKLNFLWIFNEGFLVRWNAEVGLFSLWHLENGAYFSVYLKNGVLLSGTVILYLEGRIFRTQILQYILSLCQGLMNFSVGWGRTVLHSTHFNILKHR